MFDYQSVGVVGHMGPLSALVEGTMPIREGRLRLDRTIMWVGKVNIRNL